MDFRQYDNALGRFLNPDRLSELAPGITPYRFAFNNPNYWSDPTGLFESRNAALAYMERHGIIGGNIIKRDDNWAIESGDYIIYQSGNNIRAQFYNEGTIMNLVIDTAGGGGSGGGGSSGGGMGGFEFRDGNNGGGNSDLRRKGGRDTPIIDFKGAFNLATALISWRFRPFSSSKGKGTNGGKPTIDNKTGDAIDAVSYTADAAKEVNEKIKNNRNATTMEVQNVSPVTKEIITVLLDTTNYHINIPDRTVIGNSGQMPFTGTPESIQNSKDSLNEKNRFYKNWFND